MCAPRDSGERATRRVEPIRVLTALAVLVLVTFAAVGATLAFLEFVPAESPLKVRADHVALVGLIIGALGPVLDYASAATGKSSPGRAMLSACLVLAGAMIAAVGAYTAIVAG